MIKQFWTAFSGLLIRLLSKPVWLLLLCSVSLMSLVYMNGTIVDLPVAVVDLDHSTESRRLIRALDTNAKIFVKTYDSSLQAYQDINQRKLFAVITIPRNFEKKLLHGDEISISFYSDASSRLANGLLQQDIKTMYQEILLNYNAKILNKNGLSAKQASVILNPIKSQTIPLYNAGANLAAITFPGLLVMLLQHSFLIAATRTNITLHSLPQGKPAKIIYIGSLCGLLPIWLFLSIVLFGLFPWILGYRQLANLFEIMFMTFLLLIGVVGLSKLVTECLRRIEMIYLTLAFLTTPVFYLSGIVWPIDAMPSWVQFVSKLLPSTWAINMITNVNQIGISIFDNSKDIFMLVFLGIFYGLLGTFISLLREGKIRNVKIVRFNSQ